jgi:hypothetical protein
MIGTVIINGYRHPSSGCAHEADFPVIFLFGSLRATRSMPLEDAMHIWSAIRLLLVTAAASTLVVSSPVAIAGADLNRMVMRGALPYDRSYEQLTPEQKAVVRAEYDVVGPNDEPPYPKYGLADVADAVSRMSVRDPIEGEVILTVRVDESGDAKSVSIYKTPDARLSNLVALMVTRSKFKPGLCEGRPCAMDYVFRYYFKISG